MKALTSIVLILLATSNLKAESLTVGLLGLTLHGPGAETNAADEMPRKLDGGGKLVWHPEFNMTYRTDDRLLFNMTMLKDCFDHSAYYAGVGKSYRVTENGSFQFTFGVYARPKIKKIDVTIAVTRDGMDYIPTPWVGYSYEMPLTEDLSLNAQVNTNVFLTYSSFGLTYKFK